MVTLTSTDFSRRPGEVRRAVKGGQEPPVSWRGETYAYVVSSDTRQEERDRLERQRAEMARKDAELADKDTELAGKDAELARLREENVALRSRLEEVAAV
uniref:hypothetical protein n=1 Tax=Amycolatopsis sp. CA-096443 TaxID=3239919 RepID=UPI003F490B88